MRLFPRTFFQGMHDSLVDAGAMHPFPTDKIAMAVFDQLADEAGFPPILEAPVPKTAAVQLAGRMKMASDRIAQSEYAPSVTRIAQAKYASSFDLEDRAGMVAEFYMEKAASENSLTPQGENTLADAAGYDTVAALDNRNRPEGTYTHGERGGTNLPTPGILGREVAAPGAPMAKKANLESILAAFKAAPSRIGEHASQIGSRLTSNPVQSARTALNAMGDLRAMARNNGAVRSFTNVAEHGQRLFERNEALKNLATQAGAGAVGIGSIGAGAMGIRSLMGGGKQEPAPEDIAKAAMEVCANEDMPVADVVGGGGEMGGADPEQMGRVMTFLHALKNKIPGLRPSPEAQIGAAGLGEQGEQGLQVMAHVLETAKTAEEADGMLQHILQVLTEQGDPPSPELVQAISEALSDEGGGEHPTAGAPPPPPSDGGGGEVPPDAKTAGIMDRLRAGGKSVSDAAGRGTKAVGDAARSAGNAVIHNKLRTAGGVLGSAILVGGGVAAKNHFGKKKEDEASKTAEDFWNSILKQSGDGNDGSLTSQGENTLADAAGYDTVAKLDLRNRPEGAYATAQGQTQLKTESGEVGDEKKAEDAYWDNIRKVAEEWGAKLPAAMAIEDKRAAIQKIASVAPRERAALVAGLR